MSSCIVYPEHRLDDLCFYITNVISTPVVFGAGVLGNLVCILVFNNKLLRKAGPTYAYLNGVAIVDLIGLFLIIPRYIQDSEALPPDQTHSKIMAHIVNSTPGLIAVCTHSSTWYLVMATTTFLARIDAKHYKPSWTKISISRIVAFVLFVTASLLNFPRFFANSVVLVEGHCMQGMDLWGVQVTSLGESLVYTSLYPWIITGVSFLIPFTTLTVIVIILPIKLGIRVFCHKKSFLASARQEKDKKLQLGKTLFILIIVYIIMEIPHNIAHFFMAFYGHSVTASSGFTEFMLVSELIRRIRLTLPFLIYALYDGDFRKCIRRVLCCSADQHYEPCTCTCCGPSVLEREAEDSGWVKQNTIKSENGSVKKPCKSSDSSRWV